MPTIEKKFEELTNRWDACNCDIRGNKLCNNCELHGVITKLIDAAIKQIGKE